MMIIKLVKMVGRMITVANIEKVTIETLGITVIVVTGVVVVAAIIVLALRVNTVARVAIIAIIIINWQSIQCAQDIGTKKHCYIICTHV